MTELILIAAKATNNVIGDDNRLIWRLKSDLKRFRALTMGRPLIMGRKTFESIGKPLPGRHTIVLTRQTGWASAGVEVAAHAEEALALGHRAAERMGMGEIFVAGGGEIYRLFLDRADRLEITDVALQPAGDATFPVIDGCQWRLEREALFTKSADDEADFAFRTYRRR
jgi:dihydrofolate reductase